MNYDGPSFYKKNHSKIKSVDEEKNNQADSKRESTEYGKAPLNNAKKESQPENHYFRSKYIPKSLQSLDGWKKAKRNQDLIAELEERLAKEKEDYLLFSEYLSEDQPVEKIEENSKENTDEESAKNESKIKKTTSVEKNRKKEIRVSQKIKKDLTKPNTGLHRTLSKIIAEDEEVLKNGKNNLSSLFSDK